MNKYLSIDIGGTVIKASLIDEEFNFLKNVNVPTDRNPEKFLKQLLSIVEEFKCEIKGIAICMAGFINPITGENSDYTVGENFKAYNIKKELESRFNLPVSIENDSNCAGLGELKIGAGKKYKDFALITVGTGLGAAIIINKKLLRGSHFKAGEVGLMRASLEDLKDNDHYPKAMHGLVHKVSRAISKDVDGLYIFEHLEEEPIKTIYTEWVKKIAFIIGNISSVLDIEAVIIGGGVSAENRFIDDLRKYTETLFPKFLDYTVIEQSQTGNNAGRIGALTLLLDKINN